MGVTRRKGWDLVSSPSKPMYGGFLLHHRAPIFSTKQVSMLFSDPTHLVLFGSGLWEINELTHKRYLEQGLLGTGES